MDMMPLVKEQMATTMATLNVGTVQVVRPGAEVLLHPGGRDVGNCWRAGNKTFEYALAVFLDIVYLG